MKEYFQNIAIIKIQAFLVFMSNWGLFAFTSNMLETFNLYLQLFLTSLQILIAILSAIVLIRGKLRDLFNFNLKKDDAETKGIR